MIEDLERMLTLVPTFVKTHPEVVPQLFRQAGLPVVRAACSDRLLAAFTWADRVTMVRLSDRLGDARFEALVLLHVGLRVAAGQRLGLVSPLVTDDHQLDGWLAVADLLIGDAYADHVLAEDLTVEDVAIATALPAALVHAKLAMRADLMTGRDGAPSRPGFRAVAADELRLWLGQMAAGAALSWMAM